MKVIESKILIKVINEGAYKKIGNLEIPENTLGYETGEVISVRFLSWSDKEKDILFSSRF